MDKTRIIKFRAWDKTNKEWFYSFSIEGDGTVKSYIYNQWGEPDTNISEYVDIQQFTGLLDKNGKEIYEGDIVKAQYNDGDKNIEFIDEVVWGYFDDCCVEGETWITKTDRWQKCIYYWKDELEVIGNVYENPELLLNAPVSNKETKE